jgi:hypothetical protein
VQQHACPAPFRRDPCRLSEAAPRRSQLPRAAVAHVRGRAHQQTPLGDASRRGAQTSRAGPALDAAAIRRARERLGALQRAVTR